jgi:hypothetical protein
MDNQQKDLAAIGREQIKKAKASAVTFLIDAEKHSRDVYKRYNNSPKSLSDARLASDIMKEISAQLDRDITSCESLMVEGQNKVLQTDKPLPSPQTLLNILPIQVPIGPQAALAEQERMNRVRATANGLRYCSTKVLDPQDDSSVEEILEDGMVVVKSFVINGQRETEIRKYYSSSGRPVQPKFVHVDVNNQRYADQFFEELRN